MTTKLEELIELQKSGNSELEKSNTLQERNAAELQASLADAREQTQRNAMEVVGALGAVAEINRAGFDQLDNTLQTGFTGIAYRMGYMADAITKSIKNMSADICDRLDRLHNVMENPRRTAVLELFRSAKKRFDAGFYRAALKDLNEAIEKDETDYMLYYLKGATYFSGKSDFADDNVADTDEAISALTKAAYYIKPYIEKNSEDRLIAAEIFYWLGSAKDNKYRELIASGQRDKAQLMIGEAQTAFAGGWKYAG